MTRRYIDLFMWGYQEHFQLNIKSLTRDVLRTLGADAEIDVLLVGARKEDNQLKHPVCIEPEKGKWHLSLFDGLLEDIQSKYENHDLKNMFYGDEASMRDKPEVMKRDSVRSSVLEKLKNHDITHNVTSFCGDVWPVGDYYVATVIQVSNTIFIQYPSLSTKPRVDRRQATGYASLIHSSIYAILREATAELKSPEPGRFIINGMRSVAELIRIAAKDFMHTPGIAIEQRYTYTDMYERLNVISSLMYEGTKGLGRMLLVNPDNPSVSFLIRLAQPVPFEEHRWVRKILQMATTDVSIIADSRKIYGLGRLVQSHDASLQDAFTVDFLDHYYWEIRCGNNILLRCRYGEPKLAQEPFNKSAFVANYKRLFPKSSELDALNMWDMLNHQLSLAHGSMIVIAEDAADEASRLIRQGSQIVPTKLTEELLHRVSGIDGTILLDSHGVCHAIGVILDGAANNDCTPSRGSRYNSAVRYVKQGSKKRLAIVISEDRTADIIPKLRPLISRSLVEKNIIALETATEDDYHEPRNWLDNHRFYITPEYCIRINAALDRLDNLPREVGLIYLLTERFVPNAEMEESYFID